MKIVKIEISTGPLSYGTPDQSALDVVRDKLGSGVSLKSAIKQGEAVKGRPMTSKEIEDARNLTRHEPVVYIKPRHEPTQQGVLK